MSHLLSAFIGIPVPAEFHPQLKKTQATVKKLLPHIAFSAVPTAHITLFYLGNIDAQVVPDVREIVCRNIALLKGTSVCLQHLGYFGEPAKHVYIQAHTQPAVVEYTEKLHADLHAKKMFAESLSFKPHVTIGTLVDESTSREFRFHKDYLTRLLAGLRLDFPITELVLFARLPSKENGLHQRIDTCSTIGL